jgi:hypothetical protein
MKEPREGLPDLEAVRERLRGRGYLGGRVERYLVHDALQDNELGKRRLRVALKGAFLVGPLAALWTAGVTLASDPRGLAVTDAILLWAYDFLFALPVTGFVFLLASFGVPVLRQTGWTRIVETVAILVAVLAGTGLGSLLWQSAPPAGGRALWILFGVLLAGLSGWVAGIACWFGGVAPDRPLPARSRRGVLWFAMAMLWIGMFFWAQTRLADDPGSDEWMVRERAPRLIVIGIDGLDRELFDMLAMTPDSPWSKLPAPMQSGSWTREEGTPAEVWTSVWTGRATKEHGVGSAEERHLPGMSSAIPGGQGEGDPWRRAWRVWLPGRRAPLSSAGRRIRTIWEVVALKKPVAAIGWWSTWPAILDGEGGGFIVSDRTLAKLQNGREADRETWPDGWFGRLQAGFADESERIQADFELNLLPELPEAWVEAVREAHFIDAFALERLQTFAASDEMALSMVYLPGLDIVRHRLRQSLASGNPRVLLDAKPVLERYIVWLGMRSERWFELRPGTAVLVLGDPGRGRVEEDLGLWLAWGEGIREQGVPIDFSAGDWFPWIARWLGIPRIDGMPAADSRAFEDWVTDPGRIVAWPAPPRREGSTSSDFDEEMLERLRSLGYVH